MATVTPSDVIADVVIVEPDVHGDDRGRFLESYRRDWFPHGREMVQGNRSDKQQGALVGLHDLREGSPTDGATLTFEMGDGNEVGAFIPPGVAHGFAALTDLTITYLVDQYYNPEDELGVAWDDPDLTIDWRLSDPVVSKRDQTNPRRAELPPGRRPYWGLRT